MMRLKSGNAMDSLRIVAGFRSYINLLVAFAATKCISFDRTLPSGPLARAQCSVANFGSAPED